MPRGIRYAAPHELSPQARFSMKLTCGITIPTHNRKADLERTCRAIAKLDPPPNEVLICADGCTDGSAELIQSAFPQFRLIVNKESRGSIASRDAMMRAAKSDVLISLDDDSYPLETDAIERVRQLFSSNDALAVAAFPQRSDEAPASLPQTDFGPAHFIGTFSNAGAAIRRSAFLQLGGYPVHFWHAYEEPDFALRCVVAGFEVKFEPAVTIRHHYTGVQRNEMRTHHFHARNELWSALMRCPLPQLFAVAAFRAVRQFGYAKKRGLRWMLNEPRWWFSALKLSSTLRARSPLPWRKYRAWMELVRSPIFSEAEWRRKFAE